MGVSPDTRLVRGQSVGLSASSVAKVLGRGPRHDSRSGVSRWDQRPISALRRASGILTLDDAAAPYLDPEPVPM